MIEYCYSCKFFNRGISTSPTGICSIYGNKSPMEEACKEFKLKNTGDKQKKQLARKIIFLDFE